MIAPMDMLFAHDPDLSWRVRAHRGGAATHSWEMADLTPDPRLHGLVHRISAYTEWSANLMLRLQPPVAGIPIIIGFGAPIRVAGSGYDLDRATAFVAGLDVATATTEGCGHQAGIQLDLTPLGAVCLLGMPLSEIARTVVALDDVLGRHGRDLARQLAEANDWAVRLRLTEAFALERIAANARAPHAVAHVLNALTASDGGVAVADLANDIGISRRHLTRQFQHWMGLAPSAYARILRFDRATNEIQRRRGLVDWGRLAQDCGYFDQPHFNRDFRAFTGMTPGAYVAALQPYGGIDLSVGEASGRL